MSEGEDLIQDMANKIRKIVEDNRVFVVNDFWKTGEAEIIFFRDISVALKKYEDVCHNRT